MKTSRSMRIGWGLALAATLLAAWFAPAPQDDSVALTPRVARIQPTTHQQSTSAAATSPTDPSINPAAPTSSQKSSTKLQVLRIRDRSYLADQETSIFDQAPWERPSPAVKVQPADVPPPAPATPTPPALPFRVMGRYQESGKSVVFLLQADQSWVVREGDTLAESYKVERITSNAIDLRYLPLNQVQVLEIGAAP